MINVKNPDAQPPATKLPRNSVAVATLRTWIEQATKRSSILQNNIYYQVTEPRKSNGTQKENSGKEQKISVTEDYAIQQSFQVVAPDKNNIIQGLLLKTGRYTQQKLQSMITPQFKSSINNDPLITYYAHRFKLPKEISPQFPEQTPIERRKKLPPKLRFVPYCPACRKPFSAAITCDIWKSRKQRSTTTQSDSPFCKLNSSLCVQQDFFHVIAIDNPQQDCVHKSSFWSWLYWW